MNTQATKTDATTSNSHYSRDSRHKATYAAQSDLLSLVDNFVQLGFASGPVDAINDLLYRWLVTPVTDLQSPNVQSQLHIILELTKFITQLYEYQVAIDAAVKKEVGHGN